MGEEMLRSMITVLFLMIMILLAVMIHTAFYRMARIYNWNGKRYCYLGYVPIQKDGKNFAIHIREKMVDLSHTTRYEIGLSKNFYKKNRYKDMFVYADGARNYLIIDEEALKTEIPF
ncbi:MAG: hypothetical protein J6B68_05910 [Lachnospiraceae bacterium]|nr:hypothetical protein [Lachnospiraceae bacterium]